MLQRKMCQLMMPLCHKKSCQIWQKMKHNYSKRCATIQRWVSQFASFEIFWMCDQHAWNRKIGMLDIRNECYSIEDSGNIETSNRSCGFVMHWLFASNEHLISGKSNRIELPNFEENENCVGYDLHQHWARNFTLHLDHSMLRWYLLLMPKQHPL